MRQKTEEMGKKNINVQDGIICVGLVGILILCCVPLLLISRYAYPFSDDLWYGATTYHAVQNGRGIGGVLVEAFLLSYRTYFDWQGSFSGLILMALQPGIWGEKYYGIGNCFIILSFVIIQFIALRRLVSKEKRIYAAGIWAIVCIMQILYLPNPTEGFFWFNGAIYYTFYFALEILLLSKILFIIMGGTPDKKKRFHFVTALFWAFFIGGGNLVTGIGTAVNVVFIAMIAWLTHRKEKMRVSVIALVNIGAFLLNITAPGNLIRQMEAQGTQPILQTIFQSIYFSGINFIVWTDGKMILLLLVALPFMKKLAVSGRITYK